MFETEPTSLPLFSVQAKSKNPLWSGTSYVLHHVQNSDGSLIQQIYLQHDCVREQNERISGR